MGSIRRIGTLAFVAFLGVVIPAPAQVTTGSVAGTVKDEQGGVIPGATVVLISEARGTRSAPATTGATGDFVFPNVTVGAYTIEVTMPSFKTLRRTGDLHLGLPTGTPARAVVPARGTLRRRPGYWNPSR